MDDLKVEKLLKLGKDYMLRHKMFQRLTNGKPISQHITDIMILQSYALSLTDLVYILGKGGLASEQECTALIQLIQEKQIAVDHWKIDYIYSYKGYIGFDTRRKASEWISVLFPLWLEDSYIGT